MVFKMEYTKKTIKVVEEFFKLRFPDKDIEFEKKCGYFYEWCGRFDKGTHIAYSDLESKKAWVSII